MSLDYSLELEINLEPAHILDFLHHQFHLSWNNEHKWLLKLSNIYSPQLVVTVVKLNEENQAFSQERFGFHPTLSVGFRLQLDAESDQELTSIYNSMIQIVIMTIGYYKSQAIFLFNGETVIFQNLKSELILNEDWTHWSDYPLSNITLPYQKRSL